ncbi:hypothetical protein [Massilibacteroides sp.]|uniref:hypothetical protein n=1 Tax=Massilibacteroides sp. TaxID=2034766 RepID=UPI0026333E35|nr:hypothetical protein [Massilibacteroides sp.]MDD4516581.1 hypothetical protein [Massilibacteroides sp.]
MSKILKARLYSKAENGEYENKPDLFKEDLIHCFKSNAAPESFIEGLLSFAKEMIKDGRLDSIEGYYPVVINFVQRICEALDNAEEGVS